MESLQPQRRIVQAVIAVLAVAGGGSLVVLPLGLVVSQGPATPAIASTRSHPLTVAGSSLVTSMSCYDLPVSSALLDPKSCWLTGDNSAMLIGSVPGDAGEGAVVIVQGQAQSLVQLPGSGSLQVSAVNGTSACVTDASQQYRSVDLLSGTVSAKWASGCSLSTAKSADSTPAEIAPSSTGSSAIQNSGAANSAALLSPSVTPSYYEYYSYFSACEFGTNGSCPLYEQGASTHTPPENGLVVLDFGSPCYLPTEPSVYGVEMFFQPTCIPDSSLQPLVENWISGYESQNPTNTANLTVAIGTSNSYNGVDSNYALTNAEMAASGQLWYQDLVGAISTSGLAAPVTLWGGDDMEQSSDDDWSSGTPTVAWVQGFDGASSAVGLCPLDERGYLADYGDDILGGSGSADGWTLTQVYDVAWGLPGACAEPEIYYSDMATEWQALSQWAVGVGASAIGFSGVMTEVESGTLSPNDAWSDLEADTGQSPPIASVTTISWTLQNLPVVNTVSPEQGPIPGGTQVEITGTNLSGAEAVDFGSTAATSLTLNNSDSITATAPAGSVGYVDVTVQTAVGTSASGGGDGFIYTAPAAFHPLTPTRIEDTRPGSDLPGSNEAPSGGQVLSVQVTGEGGVPTSGVSGVVVNVTVTAPTATSLVSVFPTGLAVPTASTIVFGVGQTRASLVEVALGRSGQISVFNEVGTPQVIVDVEGWYDTGAPSTGAGLYTAVDPTRIVDTREYAGNPTSYGGQTLGPGQSLQVTVAGKGGVPSSGAEAAVLNITAVDGTTGGYLEVFPTGSTPSSASLVDFKPGQAAANQDVAMLSGSGQVTILNSVGSVDVLVDVVGWYTNGSSGATTGSAFNVLVPTRAIDTRSDSGYAYSGDTLPSLQTLRVQFAGLGGVPTSGAVAVAANTSIADGTGTGDLVVWPEDQTMALSSETNWTAGQGADNLVVMGLGANGAAEVFNDSTGSIDLIIDLTGWFGTPSSSTPAVVDSVSPASGPIAGGTRVTITGANLTGATTVLVGGSDATDVTVDSATSVTATTPAGIAGFADVVVDASLGISSAQGPDGFLYEGDGAYHALTPARIADTRTGSGLPYSGQAPGPGQVLDVQVTGRGGVPTTGVEAVVLNITETGSVEAGFISAYPTGIAIPATSSIDFHAIQTQANLAEVAVGRAGQISIFNEIGWTQVIVDVEGWYDDSAPASGAGLFNSVAPERIVDTRPGTNTAYSGDAVGPGKPLTVQVSGAGGVPSGGAEAVVVNVTAVDATTAGYLTVYPAGAAPPATSNVNFTAGAAVPNQDIVELSSAGQITIASSSTTDVLVDVAGWYSDGNSGSDTGLAYHPTAPTRALDTRSGTGIAAEQSLTVQMTSLPGIPSTGASALAINLTTTGDVDPGDIQVWPYGESQPVTSELNWVAGQTTANLVVMALGSNGDLVFTNQSAGELQVVVDVSGWFGAT